MKFVFLLALIPAVLICIESYVAFCPKRYSWPCFRKVNECCSDYDCDPIQLCCFENCGNTCQFPVSFPTDGIKVNKHDPHCRVDPMFIRVPIPPIIKG
ncbi:U7-agatoxin-Ao1a like protein [Argiope bruennichi]|uniref:U7-agatoxin-Ao1a like protein n=1 Tax=Argiope bruennichi TaxID=94029 RepID=A0A8T0EBM5_ARGBR|nr:U7-agatoxin-Ao1a like protein [Argiope bruennichi]